MPSLQAEEESPHWTWAYRLQRNKRPRDIRETSVVTSLNAPSTGPGIHVDPRSILVAVGGRGGGWVEELQRANLFHVLQCLEGVRECVGDCLAALQCTAAPWHLECGFGQRGSHMLEHTKQRTHQRASDEHSRDGVPLFCCIISCRFTRSASMQVASMLELIQREADQILPGVSERQ